MYCSVLVANHFAGDKSGNHFSCKLHVIYPIKLQIVLNINAFGHKLSHIVTEAEKLPDDA